jgi:putative ABC transport system substrate-binding protein
MKRRAFISLLGGAALLTPFATRAQQALPVVGFLDPRSPDDFGYVLRAFRQGLKDAGFVEGENVVIESRFAENQLDRLPALAADLVRRRVAVIVTSGGAPSALAARAATATIPIVFGIAQDPVAAGLVASLARPGGHLTGVNFVSAELAAKRLELLRDLVPASTRVALLLNPVAPSSDATLRDLETAARAMGLQIHILNAGTSGEIDAAFATFARERSDILFVGTDPFFTSRRVQITHLATLHKVPAAYPGRQYPEVGGLMSYGASLSDALRQVGAYAGRILKGAKPADMPVVQSTKFDLVINTQTARMLGLTVSPSLLARTDEVIE